MDLGLLHTMYILQYVEYGGTCCTVTLPLTLVRCVAVKGGAAQRGAEASSFLAGVHMNATMPTYPLSPHFPAAVPDGSLLCSRCGIHTCKEEHSREAGVDIESSIYPCRARGYIIRPCTAPLLWHP